MNVVTAPGVPDYSSVALQARSHKYAVVISVLNEDGRITGQLERLRAADPPADVIIADGGSTDGSLDPAVLTDRGVTAALTKLGGGRLSAQLRMGFHYCLEAGYEGIVTMDGNGKDGVAGVSTITSALEQGYDFVQGSRFVPGGHAENTPPERYLAIRLVHAPLTSLGARHKYTDTTNGFRGHSRRFLSDPEVAPLRDVFDTYEILAYLPIRASRLGYRVTEVPVERTYPAKEPKPTKIRGMSAHSELIRILLRAARGDYDPSPSPR